MDLLERRGEAEHVCRQVSYPLRDEAVAEHHPAWQATDKRNDCTGRHIQQRRSSLSTGRAAKKKLEARLSTTKIARDWPRRRNDWLDTFQDVHIQNWGSYAHVLATTTRERLKKGQRNTRAQVSNILFITTLKNVRLILMFSGQRNTHINKAPMYNYSKKGRG